MHHEKRQLAENERDKLLKQIELFKEILNGDKKYESIRDDERINLLTSYSAHYHPSSPYKLNRHNSNNINSQPAQPQQHQQPHQSSSQLTTTAARVSVSRKSERRSTNRIEDTGLLMSDYTEDDIDISDFEEEELPKSNANKRSRARSNDMHKRESLVNGITAITTLKIGDDGTPITVTSQIKQNQAPDTQKSSSNGGDHKDMDTAFTVQPAAQQRKARKKRPSREFLQRNADESISTEDSEVFWNGSEAVAMEAAASVAQPVKPSANIHIMTPIVEAPTPSHSNTRHYTRQPLSLIHISQGIVR